MLINFIDSPKKDGLTIAVATSRFNEAITRLMQESCLQRLEKHGVSTVMVANVAGALELPLILKAMAKNSQCQALIALGAVIRGETYHFEVVANETARGLMQLQLDTGIPVANGVLTVDHESQAFSRAAQKAWDCADVAVEMASLLQQLL